MLEGAMRVVLLSVVIASLSACVHNQPAYPDLSTPQNPYPADPPKPNPGAETGRRLGERWTDCLASSFKIARTQFTDKNAAAESAFQACATEEQALYQFYGLLVGAANNGPLLAAAKVRLKQQMIAMP
jgi:hypothetical protein